MLRASVSVYVLRCLLSKNDNADVCHKVFLSGGDTHNITTYCPFVCVCLCFSALFDVNGLSVVRFVGRSVVPVVVVRLSSLESSSSLHVSSCECLFGAEGVKWRRIRRVNKRSSRTVSTTYILHIFMHSGRKGDLSIIYIQQIHTDMYMLDLCVMCKWLLRLNVLNHFCRLAIDVLVLLLLIVVVVVFLLLFALIWSHENDRLIIYTYQPTYICMYISMEQIYPSIHMDNTWVEKFQFYSKQMADVPSFCLDSDRQI